MYFVNIIFTIYQLSYNDFLTVILTIEDNNRAMARGRAYSTEGDSQYIHILQLEKDYVRMSIIDPLDHNLSLSISCGGMTTVSDECDAFILWPKRLVMVDTEVCYQNYIHFYFQIKMRNLAYII